MSPLLRWALGLGIAALLSVVPVVYYRWDYSHHKRLRAVDAGILYRSGQLTTAGFAEAVERLRIRTIVNLQNEFPDPLLRDSFLGGGSEPESEMCRRLGVRYLFIAPDLLPRGQIPSHRPTAIDQFLAIMDDPSNYPVLIHCRAGLHRTGVLSAVYHMEYEGWSWREALRDLRENGFNRFASSSANAYIQQYIQTFQPGIRGNQGKR